ncbi:MAG TPA: prepilin peptidase [Planctomycetota bacterium]|nr:prepilin peptidase [Planctomycetota bacterium]
MTPLDLPAWGIPVWVGVMGLFVGSFLNVAIHRLPKPGQSVWSPRRSHCPSCGRQLTWSENVPVLSWCLQVGRCRGCRGRISPRYPLVELLNAGLWLWVLEATPAGSWGLLSIRLTVVSALLVATFVDFDCFEIPDEVSIGGMLLAPLCALAVPALHQSTVLAQRFSADPAAGQGGVDRLGALVGCLAGIAVGGGVLLAIGWIGKRVWGRDAMGLGDVKLLAAGGGFIGPGGALAALLIASLAASLVGLAVMGGFFLRSQLRARSRGVRRPLARSVETARIAGRYLPFGPYLALGTGIALLHWDHVQHWLSAWTQM